MPDPSTTSDPPARENAERAIAYSRARYRIYFADAAYGLAVLVAAIALGLGPALRDVAARATDSPSLQSLVFAPLVFAMLAVAGIPMEVHGQRLALRYDQSIQSWTSWAADWCKGTALSIAIATVLVTILYAVIRLSPERWWLVFWIAAQPIIIFLLFLQPLVIAPLFFQFRPLAEAAPGLTAGIGRILSQAGVEIAPSRMFVMNASTKLKSVNAYVAGIGGSKRVVVWDTTLEKMTEPETLFIFGHELGHYVLGHIPKAIAVSSASLLVGLYAAQRLLEWTLGRFGDTFGIAGPADLASLPVLLFLGSLAGFFARPLFGAYSRTNEHAADVYGLEITKGIVEGPGSTAAEAFRRLGEIVLADPAPPPFIRFWLYTHPPIAERIAFAERHR